MQKRASSLLETKPHDMAITAPQEQWEACWRSVFTFNTSKNEPRWRHQAATLLMHTHNLCVRTYIYSHTSLPLILLISVGVMITDQEEIKPQSTATWWL